MNNSDSNILGVVLMMIVFAGLILTGMHNTKKKPKPTADYVINKGANIYCRGNLVFVISGCGSFSSCVYTPVYENAVHKTCSTINVNERKEQ